MSEATVPSTDGYQLGTLRPTANELSEVGAPGTTMSFRFRPARWVQFGYMGPVNGTFDEPNGSLSSGVAASPNDGIVICKAGTSFEHPTLTRPMRLKRYGGTATIGP